MKISIVGTGYVGLVTGACFAERGHEVICVDRDEARVAALNRGECPLHEAGLAELVAKHAGARLRATTDLASAVRGTDATFVAVGTPCAGRSIDLGEVFAVTRQIGAALRDTPRYHLVVVKSTVSPGTTDGQVRTILETASGRRVGEQLGLAMNPEFLSEGEAVANALFPDRIVIGAIDDRSIQQLRDIYLPFDAGIPRVVTNPRTAEMIKYASNALLATLISFSNELANLGAQIGGIDTVNVMRGVHLSNYFRARETDGLAPITDFLRAGCGFGGSCLPKDLSALIEHGTSAGSAMPILRAVLATNEAQPGVTVDLVRKHHANLHGLKVTVLGLAFKPGTSDVRASPAFPIIQLLLDQGAVVTAVDPVAVPAARAAFPDPRIRFSESLDGALVDTAAVIVVTPWQEFARVPELLRELPNPPVLVDARRAYGKHAAALYEGIGL